MIPPPDAVGRGDGTDRHAGWVFDFNDNGRLDPADGIDNDGRLDPGTETGTATSSSTTGPSPA
jgi:hypothetical protein